METLGFIGTGLMGFPMARNLVRHFGQLVVWNRSPEKSAALVSFGAQVAANPGELLDRCRIVIMMLATEDAIDDVLARAGADRSDSLNGRIVVHMGTTSPAYSAALNERIRTAGGQYVEAPVSGSRLPAENGQLVGMLAGDPDAVAEVRPWLTPVCKETFVCGPVPVRAGRRAGLRPLRYHWLRHALQHHRGLPHLPDDLRFDQRPCRRQAPLVLQGPTRQQVAEFHRVGLAHGGQDNGAPGLRHDHPTYFGTFLYDSFGNRIEAVCHRAE
jgi:hypothetical protein